MTADGRRHPDPDEAAAEAGSGLVQRLEERELELAEAKRLARLGTWAWDVRADSMSWSDEMRPVLGFRPGETDIGGATFLSRVHPHDRPHVEGALGRALRERQPYEVTHRIVRPDGEVRWLHTRGAADVDPAGVVVRLHGTAQDVTEAAVAAQLTADAAAVPELLREVATAAAEARTSGQAIALALEAIGRHSRWKGRRVFRRTAGGDLVASGIPAAGDGPDGRLRRQAEETAPIARGVAVVGRAAATGRAQWRLEGSGGPGPEGSGAEGEPEAIAVLAVPVVTEGEVGVVLELQSQDPAAPTDVWLAAMAVVAERLARVLEREHAAGPGRSDGRLYDQVTGLASRDLFLDSARRALARAARYGWGTAMFAISVGDPRHEREAPEPETRDALLGVLGRRLDDAVRVHDTASRWTAAALPDDRFALLCENVPDRHAAAVIATRVTESLRAPVELAGHSVEATVSLGIALHSGDAGAESLLFDAEEALREAQRHGGAGQRFFSDRRKPAPAHPPHELDDDLARALERREFSLAYQPKVALDSDRIAGVEALLRWEHPHRGQVPPGQFIGVAERMGLIEAIGAWVLRRACADIAHWNRTFSPRPPLTAAVNVSAAQLQSQLAETVMGILGETGVEPAWVCLEVTETAVMENLEMAIGALRDVKALGLSISVDDFGTGYSSLAYLQRLPLDELKIDRSFIRGLGTHPGDSAIAAAVVSLAHALQLSVVGEGVETTVQLEALRRLGCEHAQGYYFARPGPASGIDEMLAAAAAGGRLPMQPAAAAAETRADTGEQTVVVADDVAEVLQLLDMSLTAAGFTVHKARTGAEALAAARKTRPGCVVLDVGMPDMTGLEACRALRADPLTRDCTIVMLTALAEASDKVHAFAAGADDYIVKPFSPRDLVTRIRAALRHRAEAATPTAAGHDRDEVRSHGPAPRS